MSHLVAALALLSLSALAPDLEVTVEPRELTVGDRAAITLSLRLPADLPNGAVSWPEWQGSLGGVEILDVGPVETVALEAGERLLTQKLDVTSFEVGEAVVPPIPVQLSLAAGPRILTTGEIRLSVVSVLPADEAEAEIKPPAPPQRLALGERFWWTSSALLATCVAALALLLQQARRTGSLAGPVPLLSPREELSQALAALRSETDAESLYAGVSMTARKYLGRALGFAAPESTTSEIQRALRQHRVDADLIASTGRLLSVCDMVKFARRDASLERGRERIDEIESIADGVDEWLRPAESEDEGQLPT